MLSEQGIRPGSINMGRILRNLRYHTSQSKMVTYYRPPIYGKDSYGVETGVVSTAEILLPQLPALIRPALTADYQLEKGGANIIGAARAYTANLKTIKGMSNFDQDNNTNFNEIEGWDRLITNNRNIYTVPTSGTSGWTSGTADVTFTSDGQALTATLGADYDGKFYFTTSATNTLEADRLRFQVMASGASNISLTNFRSYNGATQDTNYAITYTPASFNIPTGSWMTVDVPFVSGTVASGTSLYDAGTRYAVTVTSGASFDYEADLRDFELRVSGAADGNTVMVRGIEFYKSIEWHVHSLKEETDAYCIFNCVRTRGKRDSIRRSYG